MVFCSSLSNNNLYGLYVKVLILLCVIYINNVSPDFNATANKKIKNYDC